MFKKFITFIAINISLLCTLNILAQQQSVFDLRVETNKTKYIIAEPILLSLFVKNASSQYYQFSSVLLPVSDFEINIIKPQHLPERYLSTMRPGLYPQVVYEMDPGDVRKVVYTILYDKESDNGLLFNKSQKAKISCKLAYNINDVNPHRYYFPNIDIQIVEPTGDDKKALEIINEKDVIYDLHRGLATDPVKPTLRKLLDSYPNSTYAPFALYALAGGELLLQNETQDSEKAIELYKQVISNYPDFPLMDYVYYRIAGCYDKLGKDRDNQEFIELANKWLIKIWNEFPMSSRIRKNDPLFKEYIFDKQEAPNPQTWMMK